MCTVLGSLIATRFAIVDLPDPGTPQKMNSFGKKAPRTSLSLQVLKCTAVAPF